jgi:hypothetical protein
MEHRDRQSVLDRRARWGSGATAEAADFGSAGSVVTVTCSVVTVRSDRWVRAEEAPHSRSGVQPTASVEKTNAIESLGDAQAVPSAVVDAVPPTYRLIAGTFRQVAGRRALPSGADL